MANGFYRMKDPTSSSDKDISVFYSESPQEFFKRFSKKNKEAHADRHNELINGNVTQTEIKSFFMDNPKEATKYLSGKASWPKGLAAATEMKDSVSGVHAQYSYKKKLSYDEDGFDLDIDRFMDYEFESMWRKMKTTARRKKKPGKVISFLQNGCDSWNVKPENFIWNGIALSALADIMEASGMRTWITLGWAVSSLCKRAPQGHTNRFFNFIDIKVPEQPLDFEHLVTWSAHPAALRVAIFRSWYNLKWVVTGSLGKVIQTNTLERYAKEIMSREFITVPRIYNKNDAIKFLQETLVELGLADREEE